jgi:hypothetical protein
MDLADEKIFKDGADYWQVAENIRDIYMSEGSLLTLLDFERVIDELDLYAFQNWDIGELVSGPEIGKYSVTCIFMWPEKRMPDPRGARRLLPFDCTVKFKKTTMKVPVKIETPSDYRPGTHKARIMEQGIPVKIAPVKSDVLVFDVNGETVFTKKEVTVKNPGGTEVVGSFERAVDEFMLGYFKQSFIRASGLYDYINKPTLYKTNFAAGSRMGRAKGIDTGFKWIANARVGV